MCVHTYTIYINVCRRYVIYVTRKEAVGKIASAMRGLPLPWLRGCPLGGSRPHGQPSSSFITGLGLAADVGRRFTDFDLNSITWEMDRLKRYLRGCSRWETLSVPLIVPIVRIFEGGRKLISILNYSSLKSLLIFQRVDLIHLIMIKEYT